MLLFTLISCESVANYKQKTVIVTSIEYKEGIASSGVIINPRTNTAKIIYSVSDKDKYDMFVIGDTLDVYSKRYIRKLLNQNDR